MLSINSHGYIAETSQQVLDESFPAVAATFSVGPMPHAKILRSIELLGAEVAPAVRKELAGGAGSGRGLAEGEHRVVPAEAEAVAERHPDR